MSILTILAIALFLVLNAGERPLVYLVEWLFG